MQKFELILKNERIKAYKTFILFFILLNIIFLVALAITTEDISTRSKVVLALLMTTISFAAEYFLQKKYKQYSARAAALLYLVLVYLLVHYWWLTLCVMVISFLYIVSLRRLAVYINDRVIIYPSFPRKIFGWSDLNNIILKDGLLTIDFKNNKLAQAEIIDAGNHSKVNEQEFNDFCKNQLLAKKKI